jgi:hypothetical protein
MRNVSFATTSSVLMPNASILDFYDISGSIYYYTPGSGTFPTDIITNIYSYVALPIRRPADSERYHTGQSDAFDTNDYTITIANDYKVTIAKTGSTPFDLTVNTNTDSYKFPNASGATLKLVKTLADGFPLFETSITGQETPLRLTILRKVTIRIAGTDSVTTNGKLIVAYVYTSRITNWFYNIKGSNTLMGDGGTPPIDMIIINRESGSQGAATTDPKFIHVISETPINNSVVSGYTSEDVTKEQIESFLRSVEYQGVKDYIFFDTMYYYMKYLVTSSTSITMVNSEVTSLYNGTTKTIRYYRPDLSYIVVKAEILANNNNTYHALPIRKPTDSSRYGDNPDEFNMLGLPAYKITTANDFSVSFIKNGGTAQTIAIDEIYEFDSELSLKLVQNPNFGFPLFEVYTAPTTTVPCLLKGTRVLTPSGYKLIESLSVDNIITNHYNQPATIRKISKTVVKWSENPPLDKKVFKTPGYQPTYLTGWHRIRGEDGTFLQAYDCGFEVAKKEEICDEVGVFVIYHLHVDDWQNNHLVVNGGTVVESWSGIYT